MSEPNSNPTEEQLQTDAAAAAEAAKIAQPKEPAISDAEAQALADHILDIKPYAPAKTNGKPGVKPKDQAQPKQERQPTPRKPKVQPTAPAVTDDAAVIDYDKLAEAAGRGAAAALAAKDAPRAKAEPDDLSFLSAAEKRQLPVLEEMAKIDDSYRGLADRYIKSLKETAAYQANWEKDHPGQEFNPDDTEHNDFYAKHEVGWEDSDFLLAAAALKAGETAEKIKGRTDAELERIAFQERVRESSAELYHQQKAVGRGVFAEFGEEWKGILSEHGQINRAEIKRLYDEMPLEAPFIINAAERAENFAVENLRMHQGMRSSLDGKSIVPLPYKADGSLNVDKLSPLQREIVEFATAAQEDIASMPKTEQRDAHGRMFMRNAEYNASKDPQKARKFWTLDAPTLNQMRTSEIVTAAKSSINSENARFAKIAGRRQNGDAEAASPNQRPPPQRQQRQPRDDDYKPNSPSLSGGVRPSSGRDGGEAAARKDGRLLVTDIL